MKFALLALLTFFSLSAVANPLDERLSFYSFSRQARLAMGSAATVAELALLRAQPFLKEAAVYFEVQEFLRSQGLHLGMTTEELEFFRRGQRLAYKSGESNVESLQLSYPAMVIVAKLGIVVLEDAPEVNIIEVKTAPGSTPELVAEIARAFADANFPLRGHYVFESMNRPKIEPLTAAALEKVAVDDMNFTSRLTATLKSLGFNTAADLWRLTKVDFYFVPGLTVDHVRKIDVNLKALGHRLATDVLDRAVLDGTPVDTTLPIRRHVFIERQLGRRQQPVDLLESLGIVTIGDLLKVEKGNLPNEYLYEDLLRRVKKAHTDLCQAKLQGDKS